MAFSKSFEELCALEPGLLDLEADIRAVRDDGESRWFCSNYAWLPLNARLKGLIGVARPGVSTAAPDDLRYSSLAYEVAYVHLSRFMPPCRSCGCEQYHPYLTAQLEQAAREAENAPLDPAPAMPRREDDLHSASS